MTQTKEEMKKKMLDLNNSFAIEGEVVEAQLNEEEKEKATDTQEKNASIYETLEKEAGITELQLAQWKEMYNDKVFFVYFDVNDYYIYRALMRPEWKSIMTQYNKSVVKTNEFLDELIVLQALLYPTYSPELIATIAAGTIETLATQIRVSSNFVPDQVALQMIQKL